MKRTVVAVGVVLLLAVIGSSRSCSREDRATAKDDAKPVGERAKKKVAPVSAKKERSPAKKPAAPAPKKKTTAEEFGIDCSEQAQKKRLDLLNNLVREGVFRKIEPGASIPKVWTGPRFAGLDFDAKQQFVSVAFAYYACAQPDVLLVHVIDHLNGKKIGSYDPHLGGLSLK